MNLLKQAFQFFGISGIGWILDLIVYTVLTSFFKLSVDISNMISSFTGVTFVFLLSTRKVFINDSKINLKIKYLVYVVYQIILIIIVSKIMLLLKNSLISFDVDFFRKYVDIIVKIIITPFTMLINFIVMKKLIEKI